MVYSGNYKVIYTINSFAFQFYLRIIPQFRGEDMTNSNPGKSDADTLFIGRYYLFIPQTESTNITLKNLIANTNLPEGAVISTGFQSVGRGQAGTKWESGIDKNILLSILLNPKFLKVSRQFSLSQAVCLGILDFINNLIPGQPVQIKWPNDIYVRSRKICGILIENTLKGEIIENTIIGIGINVNEVQTVKERTSLKSITGLDYDLRALEKLLFSFIEARYLQLQSYADFIAKDYQDNLYGFGKHLQFKNLVTDQPLHGIIIGINTDGRLIIETNTGLNLFALKEISFEPEAEVE
jgi:BirA family transcriptional regulator, biotin operon repressor / biotin---[acetyl-CoA-carboxylase] ligase